MTDDVEIARQQYEAGTLRLEVGNPIHIALLKTLEEERAGREKKKPFQFTLYYSCEKTVTVMAEDEEEAKELVESGDYDDEKEYDNFELEHMERI